MKYLKSYNEEILWSKKIRRLIKGVSKKDMYISEVFPNPTINEITKDLMFSGKEVSNIDVIKDYYIKEVDINNKGVFVHTPESYSFSQYKFKSEFNDKSEMWYNQSESFKKLREISKKIGYKIGTYVDINKGGRGVISEIINFAFYKIGSGCHEVLTLAYKVGNEYYQITQLDLSDSKNNDLIDNITKECFFDLTDDDIASYVSESKENTHKCKLIIHKFSTSILNKVTESLSLAEERLKDYDIELEIENISKSENGEYIISFRCYEKNYTK
jgi:hypothetical protein